MQDLDFITPAPRPTLDTKVAIKYFKASGTALDVPAGTTLFAEGDKAKALLFQRDLMYFLVEGEVFLMAKQSLVSTVRAGELFGEMTLITDMPRTATAVTKTACRLYTMTRDQLQSSLQTSPEFGLLLMSVMIDRLRNTIDVLQVSGALSETTSAEDSMVFDSKILSQLVETMGDTARIPYTAKKVIMEEGQSGVLVYIVLEGQVQIAIQGNVIATIGTGGMFGEMALISRGSRVASATALTDCMLLALSRNIFLDLICANPKFALTLLEAIGNRARHLASMRT